MRVYTQHVQGHRTQRVYVWVCIIHTHTRDKNAHKIRDCLLQKGATEQRESSALPYSFTWLHLHSFKSRFFFFNFLLWNLLRRVRHRAQKLVLFFNSWRCIISLTWIQEDRSWDFHLPRNGLAFCCSLYKNINIYIYINNNPTGLEKKTEQGLIPVS